MKIAIDCRMHNSSGIGTYLQGILPFLIQQEHHSFLLMGDVEVLKKYSKSNVAIQHVLIPFFSVKEFLFFPVKKLNDCDVFLTPNFNIPSNIKIPIYSFIHDVVFLDVKSIISKLGYFMVKFYLKRAIKTSEVIFTVSKFSKSRIEYHFGSKKKIIVAHGSIKQSLKDFHKIPQKKFLDDYILFVGNIKKHKGIRTLITGWELANSQGFNKKLFIVGEKDGFNTNDKGISEITNPNIQFLGKISDEEMYTYMAEAFLLVQPSEYEGFGLPPLEALYLGTSCILSDIPVFNEIYSELNNCKFFNSGNPENLSNVLLQFYSQKIDQSKIIESKYSFEKSANIIFKELNIKK